MNDLNQTLVSVNRVLRGEQAVEVQATISHRDITMLGGIIFLAMFAATSLALILVMYKK